jgi:hypothetical protein
MNHVPSLALGKSLAPAELPVDAARRSLLRWLPVPAVALVAGCGGGEPVGSEAATAQGQDKRALAAGPRGTPFNPVGTGGLLVQSDYTSFGDFEVLLPSADGHLLTMRRRNSEAGLPWEMAVGQAMSSAGTVSGASQIFSENFRNVEAVVVDGGRLRTFYRNAGAPWGQPPDVTGITNAQGQPAFIQARINGALQLHVVVGLTSGGMVHMVRNEANLQWTEVQRFGSGNVRGVAMIQSNYIFGGNGNFELVAWVGDGLQAWFRQGGSWGFNGTVLGSGVGGAPAMIQSNRGTRGNFEVLVPLTTGGLAHHWRDNDNGFIWRRHAVIGQGIYRAAGLLQAQFGPNGNLEAVGVRGDSVDVFVNLDSGAWVGTTTLNPLQSSAGPSLPGGSFRIDDVGVTGIHSVMLHDGRVLIFGFPLGGSGNASIPAVIWNPANRSTVPVAGFRNSFCSGHTTLPDGRVLIVGGHIGSTLRDVVLVNPATNSATRVAEMAANRWYPTVAPLPDGSALILGGTRSVGWNADGDIEASWQTYHPSRGLSASLPVPTPFSPHYPAGQRAVDLYPQVCVLPDGDVLVHARNSTRYLNLATRTWRSTIHRNVSPDSRTYPFAGAFAMLALRPQESYRVRLLVSGGAGASAGVPIGQKGTHSAATPALASAEVLELGISAPGWRSVAPMRQARFMHDLVTLPDGTVFCVGGNAVGHADVGTGPTLVPELYEPATNTWSNLPACRVARGYHATALLLADGRVMIAGKDGDFQGTGLRYAENRVELYSPPYLFRGARPVMAASPTELGFRGGFDIDLAPGTNSADIREVVLVACGSATHSMNFQQRLIELAFTRVSGSRLRAVAPPDGFVAPPGGYMLFVLNNALVPSVARMVRLRGADTLAAVSVEELGSQRHRVAVSLDAAGEAPRCVTPTLATGPMPGTRA